MTRKNLNKVAWWSAERRKPKKEEEEKDDAAYNLRLLFWLFGSAKPINDPIGRESQDKKKREQLLSDRKEFSLSVTRCFTNDDFVREPVNPQAFHIDTHAAALPLYPFFFFHST